MLFHKSLWIPKHTQLQQMERFSPASQPRLFLFLEITSSFKLKLRVQYTILLKETLSKHAHYRVDRYSKSINCFLLPHYVTWLHPTTRLYFVLYVIYDRSLCVPREQEYLSGYIRWAQITIFNFILSQAKRAVMFSYYLIWHHDKLLRPHKLIKPIIDIMILVHYFYVWND